MDLHFTGEQYESVYISIVKLVKDILKDPYHGNKLHKLLKKIATDGRFVFLLGFDIVLIFFLVRSLNPSRHGNPTVHNFKAILD
jgi:hypothetical protein